MTDKEIMKVIDDSLGLKDGEAKPESVLEADLGSDELDVIELAMNLEEEFGISIDDDQEADWKTVADVIKTVREGEG